MKTRKAQKKIELKKDWTQKTNQATKLIKYQLIIISLGIKRMDQNPEKGN